MGVRTYQLVQDGRGSTVRVSRTLDGLIRVELFQGQAPRATLSVAEFDTDSAQMLGLVLRDWALGKEGA